MIGSIFPIRHRGMPLFALFVGQPILLQEFGGRTDMSSLACHDGVPVTDHGRRCSVSPARPKTIIVEIIWRVSTRRGQHGPGHRPFRSIYYYSYRIG
jgi:hypothetical protein